MPKLYQLKVTLRDSKPPIWRRIQVADNTTLSELHHILQIAMGWTNSHLHAFEIGDVRYSEPPPADMVDFGDDEDEDETTVPLRKVAKEEGLKFTYVYDFGDYWQHTILLEKILPLKADTQHPVCIKGKRACPPEDCGGIWGYEELLEVIGDPDNPEHEAMLDWLGGEFDPEAFDIEAVNEELKQLG